MLRNMVTAHESKRTTMEEYSVEKPEKNKQ